MGLNQATPAVQPAASSDVSDRAARLLGVIASISATVATDPADRAARLLGVIASITATVATDPTDRAARLLGVIASITATVATDPTDRAARLLGKASEYFLGTVESLNASQTDPADGSILADTGALAAGQWKLCVTLSSGRGITTGRAEFTVQHRNAANSANIAAGAINLQLLDGDNLTFDYLVTLAANERVRVSYTNTTLNNQVSAQITGGRIS
jgi:hypothetical protein